MAVSRINNNQITHNQRRAIMLRKTFTILTVLALLTGSNLFAQNKSLKFERAERINPATESLNANTGSVAPAGTLVGDQLMFTNYDYAGNNNIPNMVDMHDFTGDGLWDLVGVAMFRDATALARQIKMFVGNRTDDFAVFDITPADGSGWGTLQVANAGPLANTALVMCHQGGNSKLWFVDLATFAVTGGNTAVAGNFPSFAYLDDGTGWLTNTSGEVWKSTDAFATFTSQGWFLDPADPAPTGYPSEYILSRSPNGQYLMHVAAWSMNGNGQFDGVVEDSSDYTGINYSTDAGATWQFEIIGRDGYTMVDNRPGYYPVFENFGQVAGIVDDNGVMHVTANGYSIYAPSAGDTTFAFAALYWNSRDRKWIAVSDETIEKDPNYDSAKRPGNGIGCAYPVPSATTDGSNIFVVWQGSEYDGPTIREWTPTATDPDVIYFTDLYYSVSGDGGVTWTQAAVLPDQSAASVQESYPSVNRWLEVGVPSSTEATAHFLYMVDEIPGTSLFAANNTSGNGSSWNYEQVVISLLDVDDSAPIVNSFELSQNYPNPFNPSTSIKYSVAERSNVTLKVFDMLGREVSTLINTTKDAGSYEVSFDASNLASGLYVYTLSAGNFTSSKKMMLMK